MLRPSRQPLSEAQAFDKLATLCAASEHCRQEMLDKCKAWGLTPDAAERVVGQLVGERFVDDNRFAPLYVRDKARFGGWGPVKVRAQLRAKGIDDETASSAIEAFDKDEWDEILLHALRQKLRTTKKDDPRKLFASMVRFGMRRGFDYASIRHALDKLIDTQDAADDF